MSSAAEHLEACRSCRCGVNCFEWYRLHERAPDWCELCSVEHFSSHIGLSHIGLLVWMDAITTLGFYHLDDARLVIDNVTRLNFVDVHAMLELGSISLLPFVALPDEDKRWIRGHHAPDSPQVKALLVAAALAA